MNWTPITYGPFEGFDGVRKKSDVGRNHLASGSLDLRYDPLQRKLIGRNGSAVQGDNDPGSTVGLLASKWQPKCRQIIEFQSQSHADGAASYGAIYTDESTKDGVFYFRSTNGADFNHELGDTYDTTNHYPAIEIGGDNGLQARTLSAFEHKWWPIWSENSTVQGRGISPTQRKMLTCGTRRAIKVGNDMLFPNLQGTPLKNYGNRYNDSTSSGTEPERVGPWGIVPPLWFPRFVSSSLAAIDTTSVRAWKENDQFFMCMTFVYEDGSESKPIVPAAKFGSGRYGTEYIDDDGLVTVPSTTGSTDYYPYLILTQVPIGQTGVVERRLYRTPKVDSSIAGVQPDISDMRLWEIIPDNTTTTFNAYNGYDEGLLLLTDDESNTRAAAAVLFGKVWPKRGRYAGTFDGRTMIGYLKDHPFAIILCPTGPGNGAPSTNSRLNNGSDDALITAGIFWYRVVEIGGPPGVKTLRLYFLDAGTATPAGAADGTTDITLTSAKTLQDVVDEINATLTTTAAGGGEWRACVAPGTNPLVTADNIDYTTSRDYGDDSLTLLNLASAGKIRAWNNAWAGPLYFTQDYMSSLPTYKNEFIHTEAGPLFVNIGQSGSAMNFLVNGPGWRRKPPENAGIFMGMAPMPDGCVVFYEKSVWRYQNRRGGTTGEDFDYRLNKISNEGCIAWDSITVGNGVVFWLSRSGVRCYGDAGGREVEMGLSDYLYEAKSGDGVLGYEIGKCAEAASSDTDGAWFSAAVLGSALYLSYRSSGTYPNRMHEYSFTGTPGGSGLSQVTNEQGMPYGWSPPWTIGYGTLGSVTKAGTGTTGLWKLGAKEEADADHSTGSGRIDRFDTGINDPGSAAITPVWYLRQDDFEGRGRRVRIRRMRWKHVTPTGSVTTIGVSRDLQRSSRATYTLSASGSDPVSFGVKRIKHAGQSPAKVVELDGSNDGLAGTPVQLFSAEVEVRGLQTPLA